MLQNGHNLDIEDYCIIILADNEKDCNRVFNEYYDKKKNFSEFGKDVLIFDKSEATQTYGYQFLLVEKFKVKSRGESRVVVGYGWEKNDLINSSS